MNTGDGGAIYISTPSLVLGWFGAIMAGTFGGGDAGSIALDVGKLSSMGQISTSSWGSGKGGDLTVNASESVSIDSGALWSTAMGIGDEAGDGGAIFIKTPSLNIESGSGIDAAGGYGDAGSIELNVDKLTLKGYISTGSDGSGKGGDIKVNAYESVFIDPDSGALDSSVSGTGDGGAISIKTPSLIGGYIMAETYGEGDDAGDAGSIRLNVEKLTLTGGMYNISTSSGAREKVVILQLMPPSLPSFQGVFGVPLWVLEIKLETEGQSLYPLPPWFWIISDELGQKPLVKELLEA